jgi:4-amino-4-deoxy-L-arabinose transferase-like glycosyltransferase
MERLRRVPPIIVLFFLVFLAFSLYTFRLDYQSLWYDEGFSVYLARMSLSEITTRTAHDIHPPFYYYLLHFWILVFGSSEFSLRFLSAVFGALMVPLLWATGRRMLGEGSGLLSAALVAISPLFLWYSQEARMYTLVTFLCLLSTYLLLRVMGGSGRRALLWTAYVVTNVVAVYTHFYAFFVLAFQLLFFVSWWVLERTGRLRQGWPILVSGLVSQGAVVAAYLPWSGFVLQRYGADVSYWEGTLRVGEVLRKTLITFSTGHSVLEMLAQPIAVGYLLILAAAVAALMLRALRRSTSAEGDEAAPASLIERHPWLTILGLVLYLGLPCLLLLVISYQRAKFHPRYLMLSAPAFFLLIGGGLAALFDLGGRRASRGRIAAVVAGYVFLCYLAVTSGYAVYNAYFDINFLKDDFRSAARFIEEHKGENEVVILTSGHYFPVFTYYYEGDDWYPIPDEPTLSAERVLGYDLADELNRILPGRDGAWVLLWQHEVVDPVGFLPMMLGTEGELVPYAGGFWGLKLLHFALPPNVRFSSEPLPEQPVRVNFDDQVALLGYSVSTEDATTDGLEVTLYGEALQDLAEDYKVSLRLRDDAGHEWGGYDGRPTSLLYPTFRWSSGEQLFGTVAITPTTGTPPGRYELQASLYSDVNLVGLDVLDEQGTPSGTTATLGSVELSPGRPVSRADVQPLCPVDVAMTEEAGLLGYDLSASSAQPGDTLLVKLYWHTFSSPTDDYVLLLRLYDEQGRLVDEVLDGPDVLGVAITVDSAKGGQAYHPANVRYPTSHWREDEVVLGQYDYRVPAHATPGRGELRATLLHCRDGLVAGPWPPSEGAPLAGDSVIAFQAPSGEEAEGMICRGSQVGAEVVLAPLEVQATERVFAAPEVRHRVEGANLGNKVALYGYDLSAEVLHPGDALYLNLYWQALEPMDTSYTVFTHLLDEGSQVRGQMDGVPLGGARPTTGWVPPEYLRDQYQLVVDSDAPPGEYLIEVGMYDASTPDFRRLPLVDSAGNVLDNRIVLDVALQVEGD